MTISKPVFENVKNLACRRRNQLLSGTDHPVNVRNNVPSDVPPLHVTASEMFEDRG